MAPVVPLHHRVPGQERPEGHARGDALGQGHDVGLEAEVLAREEPARPAHPALHLVGDEQDAVLARQVAEPLQEPGVRHDVAALALDGLHDHGGDLAGVDGGAEHGLGEKVQALDVARLFLPVHRAAVAVRVVGVDDLGHERPVAAALDGLARGEAHGPVGAAVEGPVEGHDLLAPRAQPRELDAPLPPSPRPSSRRRPARDRAPGRGARALPRAPPRCRSRSRSRTCARSGRPGP